MLNTTAFTTTLSLRSSYKTVYFTIRSRAEIFQEHFNVQTYEEAFRVRFTSKRPGPPGPISSYTKLTLPYEAPSHPGIPSLEEIAIGMETNKIGEHTAYRDVCRVGNTVVKVGWDAAIIQVSK